MAKIRDVNIGQRWTCKVSGNVVEVRVDAIRTTEAGLYRRSRTVLDLTNIKTGRKVSRSAAALRTKIGNN